MSIEKTTVQHRKIIVKAGMTAEDVKNSKDATALQKKDANVFDSDNAIWQGMTRKEAYKKGGRTLSAFNKADVDGDGTISLNELYDATALQKKDANVFDSDNAIWQGMTIKEAYKKGDQTLSAFNKADIDGDGTISLNELNRYEGPVYTLERYEDSGEINGTFEGEASGVGVAIGMNGVSPVATSGEIKGTVSGKIQTKDKQEFYSGVKIEDVKPWARDAFQKFDVAPRDGVLSKNEVKRIELLQKSKNEKTKELEELKKEISFAKEKAPLIGLINGGLAVGLVKLGISMASVTPVAGVVVGIAGVGACILVGATCLGAYERFKQIQERVKTLEQELKPLEQELKPLEQE